METPVIDVRHLSRHFRQKSGGFFRGTTLKAVDDVSFTILPGETFGIVGESGCGKSTVARSIMCLEPPTSGEIFFEGTRIDTLREYRRRGLRPRFQMVFQDSGATLNPRKRIEDILREPMLYHRIGDPHGLDTRIDELLMSVGLGPQARSRYPHEFSGGQRQRLCIARALSINPDLIVLDEPVSALDVSVQAQILNLLQNLQTERHLTYLFISHGLGAVRYISHRIAVMYRGRFVETGPCQTIFDHPAHPYTQALIDAAPSVKERKPRRKLMLSGEIGDAVPTGACPLVHRCPLSDSACLHYKPCLNPVSGEPAHLSACMRNLGAIND